MSPRLTAEQKRRCAEVALSLGTSVSSVERCMRYHTLRLAPTERNQAICTALGVPPPWGDGAAERAEVDRWIGAAEFTRRTCRVSRYTASVVIITGHAVPTKNGKWKLK